MNLSLRYKQFLDYLVISHWFQKTAVDGFEWGLPLLVLRVEMATSIVLDAWCFSICGIIEIHLRKLRDGCRGNVLRSPFRACPVGSLGHFATNASIRLKAVVKRPYEPTPQGGRGLFVVPPLAGVWSLIDVPWSKIFVRHGHLVPRNLVGGADLGPNSCSTDAAGGWKSHAGTGASVAASG